MTKKREPNAMAYCSSYYHFEKLKNGKWGYKEYNIQPNVYSIDNKWIRHKTKFTEDDIANDPKYIYGRFMKQWIYLKRVGIKDMRYHPNLFFNHLFKDDSLYISYDKPITTYKNSSGYIETHGYDLIADGWDMVKFVNECDYPNQQLIQNLIQFKTVWFHQHFPNEGGLGLADLPWLKDKYPYEILDIDTFCKEEMDVFERKFGGKV